MILISKHEDVLLHNINYLNYSLKFAKAISTGTVNIFYSHFKAAVFSLQKFVSY